MTGDPGSLTDGSRIAAQAEALGIRVSFSPDFPDDGQVLVHSPIPRAGACLYLPPSAGWAFSADRRPCETLSPAAGRRRSPRSTGGDEDRRAGVVGGPGQPAELRHRRSAGDRDGDVYVQHIGGGEGVAVTVDGHLRVDGRPGTEAYFETAAQVPCRDGSSECQFREVAAARSAPVSSAGFTGTSASIILPEGTTTRRAAVRLCLGLRYSGDDRCTGWNFTAPINVPPGPR